jgi:serine/threonine protein kinase
LSCRDIDGLLKAHGGPHQSAHPTPPTVRPSVAAAPRPSSRLQHPHILPVFDSGENSGQLWYTMPFVKGESLRQRLTWEKQLPLAQALRIVKDAAAAPALARR